MLGWSVSSMTHTGRCSVNKVTSENGGLASVSIRSNAKRPMCKSATAIVADYNCNEQAEHPAAFRFPRQKSSGGYSVWPADNSRVDEKLQNSSFERCSLSDAALSCIRQSMLSIAFSMRELLMCSCDRRAYMALNGSSIMRLS